MKNINTYYIIAFMNIITTIINMAVMLILSNSAHAYYDPDIHFWYPDSQETYNKETERIYSGEKAVEEVVEPKQEYPEGVAP